MDLALAYTPAGEAGGRGQVAGRLAVPGAGARRGDGEDHAVRGRGPGGGADRGALARLEPVRQDDVDRARPRHCCRRSSRRVLRPDRARRPAAARRGAPDLQEFGLPYASDPVISKHLARFLTRSLQNVQASDKLARAGRNRAAGGTALMPTAVLFNGGVFKAAADPRAGARAAGVLERRTSRCGSSQGFEPDLAVAQGRRDLRAAPRHRQGHAHQGRRRALVLYRAGDVDAGHSRASGRRSRRSASCRRACRRAPSS